MTENNWSEVNVNDVQNDLCPTIDDDHVPTHCSLAEFYSSASFLMDLDDGSPEHTNNFDAQSGDLIYNGVEPNYFNVNNGLMENSLGNLHLINLEHRTMTNFELRNLNEAGDFTFNGVEDDYSNVDSKLIESSLDSPDLVNLYHRTITNLELRNLNEAGDYTFNGVEDDYSNVDSKLIERSLDNRDFINLDHRTITNLEVLNLDQSEDFNYKEGENCYLDEKSGLMGKYLSNPEKSHDFEAQNQSHLNDKCSFMEYFGISEIPYASKVGNLNQSANIVNQGVKNNNLTSNLFQFGNSNENHNYFDDNSSEVTDDADEGREFMDPWETYSNDTDSYEETDMFEDPNGAYFLPIAPEDFDSHVVTYKGNIEHWPAGAMIIFRCTGCKNLFLDYEFKRHVCDKELHILREISGMQNPFVSLESICQKLLREDHQKQVNLTNDDNLLDFEDTFVDKGDTQYICKMCKVHLYNLIELSDHIRSNSHCIAFNTINNENFHYIDTEKNFIKCTECCRLFYDLEQAHTHMIEHKMQSNDDQNHNQIANFMNDSYVIKDRDPILKYELVVTVLHCQFCEYLFTDTTLLLNHSRQHNPIYGFHCFSCKINVETTTEIIDHWKRKCIYKKKMKNLHLVSLTHFVCDVCEHAFNTIDLLYKHRYANCHFFFRRNGTLLQMACEKCGEIFNAIDDMLDHKQERHYGRKRKGTLTFRRYLCDLCGKNYTQSSHLWQHLRFHKGVKPFVCESEGCGRNFTIRPDLNDHIRKCHTLERPFVCADCGKRFLTGSVYYQHRLIHRNERRYGCDECGKRFYRADALKNHHRIHTGEKPFLCIYCEKAFRQKGDRDKHSRVRHQNPRAKEVLLNFQKNQKKKKQKKSDKNKENTAPE